jgi:hypothetical protein
MCKGERLTSRLAQGRTIGLAAAAPPNASLADSDIDGLQRAELRPRAADLVGYVGPVGGDDMLAAFVG